MCTRALALTAALLPLVLLAAPPAIFAGAGIVLAEVLAQLPVDVATPRRPANVVASYDIVGYDDSGFMGNWFS